MRIYIAGPMSRASFCRCDSPTSRHRSTVTTNLEGTRSRNSVLESDVGVGHATDTVLSHDGSGGDDPNRTLLPESDLLKDARGSSGAEPRRHLTQQSDGLVSARTPEPPTLYAEPIGFVRTGNTTDPRAIDHEHEDVVIGGTDPDMQRPLVRGAVHDRALALEKAGTPGNVDCPVHGSILPDDGIDPWDFNYPAFHAAEAQLRALGYDVLNPASNFEDTSKPWDFYMRHAIRQVTHADAIALLPGWDVSKGASLEHHIGRALGLDIHVLSVWLS